MVFVAQQEGDGVPLATSYLGLKLQSPLIAVVSTLDSNFDDLRRMEDAGAAALVLPSLFQEQIEAESGGTRNGDNSAGSVTSPHYFPAAASRPYGVRPDHYLELVRRAFEAVSVPVIASLSGSSRAQWIDYALLFEQAGAAALELDLHHVPTDLQESGSNVEARYLDVVKAVCSAVTLPVSVKLTPHLSSIGNFATTVVEHGAAGVVLFNRPLRVDIDIMRMSLTDTLELSNLADMPLPLLWTALLAGRLNASIATNADTYTASTIVKCLIAGADVVMTGSAWLRRDIAYISNLEDGLRAWMDRLGVDALTDIRGLLSWHRSRDHRVYTRANYLRILEGHAAGAGVAD